MKVAVVTPTIGSHHLEDCVESVQSQTYENLTHYLFIDGKDYVDRTLDTIWQDHCSNGDKPISLIQMDENIGKGWYGHRVYAACSFLVNADIICYLDEDNTYDIDHVQSLVDVIERGNDWAYSLRKIMNKSGEFLCYDNCESLGKWSVYFNNDTYHIDTSSFAVKKDVAVRIGHAWYGQWGADRQFFYTLKKHFPKFDCNRLHTLNYRLDGNDNSVNHDFFIEGNKIMEQKYPKGYPWEMRELGKEIGPGIILVE